MAQTGTGSSSYSYAGEWTDATGLQYLRARYYSPAQGWFISEDPFPGLLTQPASLTPYVYALNNPVLYTDPSGEIVPIFAIAGIGFAAGAIYDAYQQTNGFTNFCGYNIAQTLAMGVGGAAAATSAVIMAVSGVGLVGMGLQGAVLGLSSLGLSGSILTSTFIAGTTAIGWSSTAMAWLFTSTSSVDSIRQTLSSAATQAQNNVANGNGSVHGTRVHTEFRGLINNLGRNDQ
ncbi:RHS repeat-associated core domain-containing protein [Longilinea arvoryzae]|uniref:RHS repeat-associated core domain-containing protein n=1 Tax=Longilinea arvoryzae TaxID=360412 RepID=UPI0009F909B4|nr:RHS repeat-associated core domain-containing protein [Longilinea arvoryzae]